jgi:hypothetical protein
MAKTFDFEQFRYVPSLAGAIVGIVIFSLLAALHLWQLLSKKRKVMIWVVIGACCEYTANGPPCFINLISLSMLMPLIQVKSLATQHGLRRILTRSLGQPSSSKDASSSSARSSSLPRFT